MKRGLLVLCCMFVCGIANAADWVQYSATSEFALYYDKSSVETTDENNVRLSIKTLYSTPRKHPNKSAYVQSVISISEIACETKQYRPLLLTLYLVGGTTDTGHTNEIWHSIAPEMPIAKLHKIICVK